MTTENTKTMSDHEAIRACINGCARHLNEVYQDSAEAAELELLEIAQRLDGLQQLGEELSTENRRLGSQVTELQRRGTELVEENRALRAALAAAYRRRYPSEEHRQADVADFFRIAKQEVGSSPHVPSIERLRTHLRIDAEEFCEKLEAAGCAERFVAAVRAAIDVAINNAERELVDLVALADACIDQLYTTEGLLTACGIESRPLWDVVHANNMAKEGGPVVDGKLRKPDGWQPPDIAHELREQGWKP